MRSWTLIVAGVALALTSGAGVAAPQDDLKAFQEFHKKRYAAVPFDDFANGIYAIDANRRAEWEQMEEFPQYELDI